MSKDQFGLPYLRPISYGFVLAIFILSGCPASAILIDKNGAVTYQTTQPTASDIPNWTHGWPSGGITGWDYVGQINGGTSAVYLGDNWVITAAHAGAGPFVLAGVTYQPVPKSEKSIDDYNGPVDLALFKIATAPPLPPLILSSFGPAVGDPVMIIAYGGGHGKTWARNAVTGIDLGVRAAGTFKTIDFATAYSGDNQAKLAAGDSGGGVFLYNSSDARWELTGIAEAIDPNSNSYMIQISTYATRINALRYGTWPRLERLGLILLGSLVALLVFWQTYSRLRR